MLDVHKNVRYNNFGINELAIVDEIEYNGTIKIIRMWTHYDKVR